MLEVTPFEFFARGLPEAFLFIFAAYAFSKKIISINRYIISSVLFVIIVYTIRFFPINIGVHTILNYFVFIVLIVNINNINLIEAIKVVTITLILQFACEAVNVLIIEHIFKADMNYIFSNPFLKVLYGIPSILIFACIVAIYYIILLKRKELKYISNGENIR